MIDRNDMLELTRRMTLTRTCFKRIAGAYMDRDGEIDDTINVNFLNLKSSDRQIHLDIAKTVPFSKTNVQLKEHRFKSEQMKPGTFRHLLHLIESCGLKNDALMETFYEETGKYYTAASPYAIMVYHGTYDVPIKSTAGDYQYESEEVYDFIICTISPVSGDYEIGKPDFGFLYPAFSYRSADRGAVDVYNRKPEFPQTELTRAIMGESTI
ncbi:MAG: DUF4317 family protein [Lachnospiraceae bacterium]|nr:DUF4317 family protein [Lachnospiraceae bacterium]